MGRRKDRRYNPYADQHDLVYDTEEEGEQVQDAARGLYAVISGMPGWLVEETDLQKALDLLENAVMRDETDR